MTIKTDISAITNPLTESIQQIEQIASFENLAALDPIQSIPASEPKEYSFYESTWDFFSNGFDLQTVNVTEALPAVSFPNLWGMTAISVDQDTDNAELRNSGSFDSVLEPFTAFTSNMPNMPTVSWDFLSSSDKTSSVEVKSAKESEQAAIKRRQQAIKREKIVRRQRIKELIKAKKAQAMILKSLPPQISELRQKLQKHNIFDDNKTILPRRSTFSSFVFSFLKPMRSTDERALDNVIQADFDSLSHCNQTSIVISEAKSINNNVPSSNDATNDSSVTMKWLILSVASRALFMHLESSSDKRKSTEAKLLNQEIAIDDIFRILRMFWSEYKPNGQFLEEYEIVEIEDAFIAWLLDPKRLKKQQSIMDSNDVDSHHIEFMKIKFKYFVSWLESVCKQIIEIKDRKVVFEASSPPSSPKSSKKRTNRAMTLTYEGMGLTASNGYGMSALFDYQNPSLPSSPRSTPASPRNVSSKA